MDQAQTPQVPNIAPVAQAGGGSDIGAMLEQVAPAASAPLPPQYIQGTTLSEPRVQPITPFVPRSTNNQPITNQATSVSEARRKNSFAEIGNLIGNAGQQILQRKQDSLKADLTEVMKAKQNIANANQVLQTDPNNEMAKKVRDENTKSLNGILSDPKKQKQLAKALDISFTDPEKNKTPEVQAYQAAAKEFKDAGAFNSDNPAEHQVSLQALQPGAKPQSQQAPQPQAAQIPKSATPYADAALKKDMPSIQDNPQYAIALKQKEEAQKLITQYVIPRMIAAESAAQIQAVKDKNAGARAEFNGATSIQREAMRVAGNIETTNARVAGELKVQGLRDSAAMSRTILSVNARLTIAANKLLDPASQTKLKAEALATIDKDINTVATTQATLGKARGDAVVAKDDDRVKEIDQIMQYNQVHMAALSAFREKSAAKAYGYVAETNPNAGSKSSVDTSTIQVGLDNSDSGDDSDDDSDEY